ncbi:hypothetical protein QQS21_010615, partial [Conoideocrella luteorostrata]
VKSIEKDAVISRPSRERRGNIDRSKLSQIPQYLGQIVGLAKLEIYGWLTRLDGSSKWKKLDKNDKIIQKQAPWGLARISESRPYRTKYTYHKSAGAGSCVYIIDSGVDAHHPEFQGRVKRLMDLYPNSDNKICGHGTHIAGIIGSTKYGVAKKTTIFDVKVENDKGETTVSKIVEGIDFITKDIPSRNCPKGIVVQISPYQASEAIKEAIKRLLTKQAFVVVGAGDKGMLVPEEYRAASSHFSIVGAIQKGDKFSVYSNYGPLVDLLAPGTAILSTWPGGGTKILSGTAMASAHVAGLGAYLLGLDQNSISLDQYMAVTGRYDVVDLGLRKQSQTNSVLINNRLAAFD